jgi:hypothetical protein
MLGMRASHREPAKPSRAVDIPEVCTLLLFRACRLGVLSRDRDRDGDKFTQLKADPSSLCIRECLPVLLGKPVLVLCLRVLLWDGDGDWSSGGRESHRRSKDLWYARFPPAACIAIAWS